MAHRSRGGETPLQAVCRQDHLGAVEAAQRLLEARAEVEATNEDGHSALALALRRRNHRVAAVLRSHGAVEPADDLAAALGGRVRCLGPEVGRGSDPLSPLQDMEVEAVLPLAQSIEPGNAMC